MQSITADLEALTGLFDQGSLKTKNTQSFILADTPLAFNRQSLLMKQMLHPRCEEINQKGDDPRTDRMKKGADSELPGWQPKEKATDC